MKKNQMLSWISAVLLIIFLILVLTNIGSGMSFSQVVAMLSIISILALLASIFSTKGKIRLLFIFLSSLAVLYTLLGSYAARYIID